MVRGVHNRTTIILSIVLVLLLVSGCGALRKSEVLRTEEIVLDGYAYDADFVKVGDANLSMQIEVIRLRRYRADDLLQLRGVGTLRIADQEFRVALPATSPSFLSVDPGSCQDYFLGGGQHATLQGETHYIDFRLSESLNAAYGLIGSNPLSKPAPDLSNTDVAVQSPGFSSVCFDDEGKTNWEIFHIDDRDYVAFTLGPEANSLEKLVGYRNRHRP